MALTAPPFATRDTQEFQRLLTLAWQYAGQPRVSYSSWYRTPYDNARVGGHPNSQHLTGLAVDVPTRTASAGARNFVAMAQRVGLVVIDEGDHWHIQRYAASPGQGLCCVSSAPQASLLERAFGFVTKPRFSFIDLIPF